MDNILVSAPLRHLVRVNELLDRLHTKNTVGKFVVLTLETDFEK